MQKACCNKRCKKPVTFFKTRDTRPATIREILFVSAHVVITYLTAAGLLKNLCLVLLLLLAGSLVPKFHFQLTKKSQREVPEKVKHTTIWQMAWQLKLSSMLCTLKEHALLTNGNTRYIQINHKNNYLLQVVPRPGTLNKSKPGWITGGTHFWNNQILFSLLITDLYSKKERKYWKIMHVIYAVNFRWV